MNENDLVFKKIERDYPLIESVISLSIGYATPEKVKRVLQSYAESNQFLMGAFKAKSLIGIVGFEMQDQNLIIRHISVLEASRNQGIGKLLIFKLVEEHHPSKVSLQTDGQAVEFYKKVGFICEKMDSIYKDRYLCVLKPSYI